ncbi:Hypothetical_protein [Hexamita inflata]|uniref:Hypothetical_protein n=1 Tax=Hexamita inflata TaxID=28002 RepID=A0AA86NV04_9EUKA|nr:Hypothetical protein HINF_LOCUS14350 [Hexamita inflata]
MHFTRTQYYKYGLDHIFRLSVLVRYVICGKNSIGNLSFYKSHAPLLKVVQWIRLSIREVIVAQNILSFAYLCQRRRIFRNTILILHYKSENNIEQTEVDYRTWTNSLCRILFWILVPGIVSSQMYFPFPTWTVGIRFYKIFQSADGAWISAILLILFTLFYQHYYFQCEKLLNAQYRLYMAPLCVNSET